MLSIIFVIRLESLNINWCALLPKNQLVPASPLPLLTLSLILSLIFLALVSSLSPSPTWLTTVVLIAYSNIIVMYLDTSLVTHPIPLLTLSIASIFKLFSKVKECLLYEGETVSEIRWVARRVKRRFGTCVEEGRRGWNMRRRMSRHRSLRWDLSTEWCSCVLLHYMLGTFGWVFM